ncbi:MAG: ABC transporter ATP-binding protein [Anaerolineae bacterium]|nr:ABC transporter ATP-binding protein [Anaerolineae bacterium]
MIEIRDLTKVYQMGEVEVHALNGVSLDIDQGEWVAIMGPSGSGKSTMMHIIGCLDIPTSGSYILDGVDVSQMVESQLAAVRNHKIGFVFQAYNLLARTSAIKQVMLPMQYSRDGSRVPRAERRERAEEALEVVGMADRINHRPSELSGGERQRVAIARALVTNPSILMADEPTGNLDSKSGIEVMEVFHRLHEGRGITVVMVTHDEAISADAERVIRLFDGRIERVDRNGLRSEVESQKSKVGIPAQLMSDVGVVTPDKGSERC